MGNADGDGEYGNDSLAGVTNSVDIDIDDGRCWTGDDIENDARGDGDDDNECDDIDIWSYRLSH